MNSLSTSSNAETVPIYQAAINPDPSINTDANNNRYIPWTAAEIIKHHSGEFSSALAHEVRNPLATIKLSVEMLESVLKDDSLKTYLDIIMRSSVRINDLINQFLKYQYAEEVQTEEHSIHQLLNKALEIVEDRIKLKNIEVRKDYAPSDCKIILNEPKMKIALTNIIINAIDAMPSENGKLNLVTKSVEDKYVVQIEDNGCGMSEENLNLIFKKFFTTKSDGLGLGLPITYDILQANHILVKVESKVGEGTRFTLLFDKKPAAPNS